MKIVSALLRTLDKISKPMAAYAHCDIPCGIYETDTSTHAAHTVYVLTEKIMKLEKPEDEKGKKDYMNTMTRMVGVKEEHAQLCKEQLLILWTDYFKAEHLAKYPKLHDTFWMATKQCSTVKREINLEAAQKLKDMVADIAKIFAETKK